MEEQDYFDLLIELLHREDEKPFDREKWEKALEAFLAAELPTPPREQKKRL